MLVLLLRTARLTNGLRGLWPELDRADYPAGVQFTLTRKDSSKLHARVHDSRTLGSLAGLITLCGCLGDQRSDELRSLRFVRGRNVARQAIYLGAKLAKDIRAKLVIPVISTSMIVQDGYETFWTG